jgi:hypothetical protein
MSTIDLSYDWLPGDGVRGPELAATWACFTLRIDGTPVTRVLDERSQTTRDHVYLPLYPLAEWLATHWWILLHDVEAPAKTGDRSFALRHSLCDAREGYALPPLAIVPQGETIRLTWDQEVLPHHRIEFLTRGQIDVPTASFRTPVADFIRTVIGRLQELRIEKTLLEEEWEAIESADPDEREYCASTAALGLDPYSLEDAQRAEIVSIGDRVPASLRSEFFSVARAERLGDELRVVLDALEIGRASSADLPTIKELRSEIQALPVLRTPEPPWRKGYAVAREVRRQLDLDGQPIPSLPALSTAFGVTSAELDKAIHVSPFPTAAFDALVGPNDKGSPGFVVTARNEQQQRFHLCRGLFEYFTNATLDAALLTGARTDRQARNRAFAAEFLAPAEGLRDRASGGTVTTDEVDILASEFGVSPWVIKHQLENHEIASISL